nr:PREDICTED: uncharacterized protein LOC100560804 [Anolis carolinensis]|eukprot:XP_003229242.1 PREDICTED: uncharacterized protein LOC100560804 [Anolis carolinensis]
MAHSASEEREKRPEDTDFKINNPMEESMFLGEEMAHSASEEREKRPAHTLFKRNNPIEGSNPPAFALSLEKEADPASLPKFHLGKENPSVSNKVIMVMGETGSGKTTLINGMVNYILGVQWEDEFRFKLIHEQTNRSQAESQTSDVTAYVVNHQEGFEVPYSLTIIDTPGFGDTRGIEHDKLITEKIRKFFSSPGGIGHIDSVCFVVQASLARLTKTQKYIFDSVLSIFGRDIKDNIQVLVTFADGQTPPVLEAIKEAGVPCAKEPSGTPIHFKFNNSALFASNARGCAESFTFDKMFWDMGQKSMQTFFDSLDNMEIRSLTLTNEVLRERMELETTLVGLEKQIKVVLINVRKLETVQKSVDQHKEDIEANKNSEYDIEEVEFIKQDTEDCATNCRECKFTCHYPCLDTGNYLNRFCTAIHFFSGKCNVCPGHCSVKSHVQEKCNYETRVTKKKRTYDDLKEKFGNDLDKITSEKEKQTATLKELIEKASQSHRRLQEISLKPSPLPTKEYIRLLIQAKQQEINECVGGPERIESLAVTPLCCPKENICQEKRNRERK